MQFVDILICVPLLFGLAKGLRNGLLVELISALSYIIAIYLAIKFAVQFGVWVGVKMGWDDSTAQLMAFVILLVAVVVGLNFAATLFTKMVQLSGLGLLNRAGGALVGTLKVALVMSVLLHFIERYQVTHLVISEEKQEKALLWKPLMRFSTIAYPQMSEWYDEAKIIWDNQPVETEK